MGTVMWAVLALAAGAGVGMCAGRHMGRSAYAREINATIESARNDAERIRSEAKADGEKTRLESVRLLEKAERDASAIRTDADRIVEEAKQKRDSADRIQAEAELARQRIEASAKDVHDAKLKEAELEIQKKTIERQDKLDKEEKRRLEGIVQTEARLVKKEELLDKRSEMLDAREAELKNVETNIKKAAKQTKKRMKQSEEMLEEAQKKLEEISEMTADEAKAMVIASITEEAKFEAAKIARQIEDDATMEAEKRAKTILSVAVQRFAGDYVAERCVRTVNLPSDEVKGRIIGREGRNIRSIEAATGVDLIVDDTPETVVISAFDPIRREVAAQTLKRLIADGRIHPGRIEETVAKVRQEIDERIREAGDQAFFELGIQNVDSEVIMMIGRLKYRTSYGQNVLRHSVEVAFLAGIMAEELGEDAATARRAGLLHDIGKAFPHDVEGTHVQIGVNAAKKFKESREVIHAIEAHHNDVEPTTIIAVLVQAADAISAARPGARREDLENYIKRLEKLEEIAVSFPGVDKAYAIQAGREIRVMVKPEEVNDAGMKVIARDMAKKIKDEVKYPGQIKVNLIRESRAVDYAK